jgi:septum site-determining protein MinD
MRGFKTAVIDFDVGLRNLDLIMGCERRVVYDLINVINGEANLTQALIKDKHCDNLFVLPASQTRDKDALTEEGVEKVLKDLEHMGFDYIVCDSPAGIEHGAVMALTFADEAIIVTNPEVSSVRDSDRILGILQSKSRRAIEGREPVKEHLLITRYSPKRVEAMAKCSPTRTCRKSCAFRSSASFPNRKSCCRPPIRATPAIHQKERRCAGLRRTWWPLPRRRASAALRRLRKARPAEAPVRRQVRMSLLSMIFGNKPKTADRQGTAAAHHRPRARREFGSSPTSCPPAAGTGRRHLEVRQA